jgi:hypothetical protein
MRGPIENARPKRSTSGLAPLVLLAALGGTVRADEPVTFAGGRIRLGGEASGTYSTPDDRSYFNNTDYLRSNLRLFRLNLDVEAHAGAHVALVGQVRSDNLDSPRPYALYLRVRPWTARAFDIQAGRIPPVFGAYPRRRYALDNPLPGMPLAYQYLTILRADALPYSTDDFHAQQGNGWLVRGYPIGNPHPAPGLPLVNAEHWDTGVEMRIGADPLQLAVAVTQGSLSHPLVEDDNDGKQVSARLAWRPAVGLVLGASGAHGDYLSHEATDPLSASSRGAYRQNAAGLDAEYSAGYWILRAEAVWTGWQLPPLPGGRVDRVEALGVMLEARYKVATGFYLAGRADYLGFGRVESVPAPFPWDAPVTRLEIGAGYSPIRRLLLKASFQHNRRDGGHVRMRNYLAGQAVLWF